MEEFETIDAYVARFGPELRARLEKMRSLIRAAAPEATEKISYRMPTFFLHGNLVHFAGYAGHVGFYPGASGVARFADELGGYKWAKGSIQLPHDRPIPAALVRKITKFRVAENLARAALRGGARAEPKRRVAATARAEAAPERRVAPKVSVRAKAAPERRVAPKVSVRAKAAPRGRSSEPAASTRSRAKPR